MCSAGLQFGIVLREVSVIARARREIAMVLNLLAGKPVATQPVAAHGTGAAGATGQQQRPLPAIWRQGVRPCGLRRH